MYDYKVNHHNKDTGEIVFISEFKTQEQATNFANMRSRETGREYFVTLNGTQIHTTKNLKSKFN